MQSQESILFQFCDLPRVPGAVAARPVLHVVADGEVLPLWVDSVGTWTTGVVEVVPGVPAATIPAHLDKPRPDLIRWCVDCDSHRRAPFAVGDQSGTGIRPGDFLIGCAPAHEPRTDPPSITTAAVAATGPQRQRQDQCVAVELSPAGRRLTRGGWVIRAAMA
jgi:hypothetical protein